MEVTNEMIEIACRAAFTSPVSENRKADMKAALEAVFAMVEKEKNKEADTDYWMERNSKQSADNVPTLSDFMYSNMQTVEQKEYNLVMKLSEYLDKYMMRKE